MDAIQKSARESSGGFMYNLIWEARKSDQKWLWIVVFLATALQSLWVSLAFAGIAYVGYFKEFFPFWFVWMILFSGNFLIDLFFCKENLFRALSQFISIAGDMNRFREKSTSVIAKFFAKSLFLLSGSIAVAHALVLYSAYVWQWKALSSTDLDVLGNALSHAKFWKQARRVYDEVSTRYMARFQNDVDTLQVSVSFGMACKWMLSDPALTSSGRLNKKIMILQIMIDYPSLPIEVTMRYREVLGGMPVGLTD